MRKIGGLLLLIGLCILIVWGIVQWIREIFPSVPDYVSVAIVLALVGLCLIIFSLIRERLKDKEEDKKKFKGVEK